MSRVTSNATTTFDAGHLASDAPLSQRLAAPFVGLIRSVRRAVAERRLRDTLADMDDALLMDIGVARDEIYRIRARERFTPRAWQDPAEREWRFKS